MADIVFNGGDEIVEPFRIEVDDEVVSLVGCTVTAEIWWRGQKRIDLADGSGLEVTAQTPAGDDDPHGTMTLSELQSATIPMGRVAFLRYVVVNADDVTISTDKTYLDRRL